MICKHIPKVEYQGKPPEEEEYHNDVLKIRGRGVPRSHEALKGKPNLYDFVKELNFLKEFYPCGVHMTQDAEKYVIM